MKFFIYYFDKVQPSIPKAPPPQGGNVQASPPTPAIISPPTGTISKTLASYYFLFANLMLCLIIFANKSAI